LDGPDAWAAGSNSRETAVSLHDITHVSISVEFKKNGDWVTAMGRLVQFSLYGDNDAE
jgi:hypothetical protein